MRSCPDSLLIVLLRMLLLLPILASITSGCPDKCGELRVPYPFGIGPGCSLPGFEVSCSGDPTPAAFLPGTTLRILSIANGEMRVDSKPYIARDCAGGYRSAAHISLPGDGPFTISNASNRFVAIGCDTVAVISDGGTFTSGCVSLCSTRESVSAGACSGVGCCTAAVPAGRRYLGLGATNMYGYADVSGFNNCSYSFVVESGGFEFAFADLQEFARGRSIAIVLEWAIGKSGCSDDKSPCGRNARCVSSGRGSGYLCNCSVGYSGNPYVRGPGGCEDVDECRSQETNPCVAAARCRNQVPGYRCQCPFGSTGDGTKHGSGCRKIFQTIETVLGTGLGFAMLLLCGLWFYSAMKKRELIKLREQYFRQNGGWLLKQQVSTREGRGDCARIFSSEELKKATHDYDDAKILGAGGYGTVYKGALQDGTVVAIKKSKVMDQAQIDQFINEVVILSQINHRNVVRLLGCCLETEVPMLVYEFISNGTLYKHIHEGGSRISWRDRVRIATETAEALAYLHSAASMPIFHRDIKSSNILLDENYTAKVSDFGISRLVPLDQTQVPTLVQGTLGYLDPEYFQTGQLTAKSDVYSFGVVLVELLTGQKPVSTERSKDESNLAMFFLSSMKTKGLGELVDREVRREADVEQLRAVADLARKCLLLRGEKRPSMKEVAQELAVIAGCGKNIDVEEMEELEEDEYRALINRSLTLCETDDSLPADLPAASVDLAR